MCLYVRVGRAWIIVRLCQCVRRALSFTLAATARSHADVFEPDKALMNERCFFFLRPFLNHNEKANEEKLLPRCRIQHQRLSVAELTHRYRRRLKRYS